MNELSKCKLMVCSVGGSPEQILYSLKTIQPKDVVFYCSTQTVDLVNDFIRECQFIKRHYVIETENVEDIDENLQLLYKELKLLVNRRQISWSDVVVDYTGGTKTMSSALVLATIDKGVKYVYISGKERSKEGIGIVIEGTEKMLLTSNPWNSIAYLQRRDVANAFNLGRYDEAIKLCEKMGTFLSTSSPWKNIFSNLIHIIEGYQYWDRFQHKQALQKLNRGFNQLKPYRFIEKSIDQLLNEVEQNISILEKAISKDVNEKSKFILEDLISNAIRRGRVEKKFDDGVARLYRSLELIAQNRLMLKYNINTSNCPLDKIPEQIRKEYKMKYWDDESKSLKMGLKASYELLAEMNDEIGLKYRQNKKEIFNRLNLRNKSILAHGLQPVTENGFDSLLEIILKFTGMEEEKIITFPNMIL